jgi:hypothetical protein
MKISLQNFKHNAVHRAYACHSPTIQHIQCPALSDKESDILHSVSYKCSKGIFSV